jgi:N-formylglutamate amidohydrolase
LFAPVLLLTWSTVSLRAQERAVEQKFLVIERGTLPIILSAPHGGRLPIPDVPERTGDGIAKFVTVRDTFTDDLTDKLASAIEKQLGGRPYVVIANFERKYADANRSAMNAFESADAKPHYETYHDALKSACQEIQDRWGRGLLLDIHGQASNEQAIFRGTNNGKSVTHLVDRFGKAGLMGPKSIFGVLATKKYTIFPAIDSTDKEDARFNGGYIVQTYGSAGGGTIDAIQLELGGQLRSPKNHAATAADIADAVAVFAKEYLPAEKKRYVIPRP